MKKIFAFLLVLVVFPLIALPVFAQTLENNKTLVFEKNKTVEDDYFAYGEKVQLSGIVNGDAYVAGGSVNFDGVVNGDLMAAGGQVNIRGTVAQDLRVVGGQIIISGRVNGNITAVGGSIEITDSAQIGGSIAAGGGSFNLFAPVTKGATIASGQATIGNTIGGNVTAGVEELTLSPTAQVFGNLTYWSKQEADIQNGSEVIGSITHKTPLKPQVSGDSAKPLIQGASIVFTLLSFVSILIIGFIFVKFMPNLSQSTANNVREKPFIAFLLGLVAIVLFPFLFVILLITVVGIPIALISLAALLIALYVSKIFVAIAFGQLLLSKDKGKIDKQLLPSMALGLLAYYLVSLVPFIGFIVGFITIPTGLGAILITKKKYFSSLSSKNIL